MKGRKNRSMQSVCRWIYLNNIRQWRVVVQNAVQAVMSISYFGFRPYRARDGLVDIKRKRLTTRTTFAKWCRPKQKNNVCTNIVRPQYFMLEPLSLRGRSRHHHRPTYRGGSAADSRTQLSLPTPPSLSLRPSPAVFAREALSVDHGSTAIALSQRNRKTLGDTSTRSENSIPLLAARDPSGNSNAAASGKSAEGTGSSTLSRSSSVKARVAVRRAKERDYQGVADIREVIIPVGMSGATGFLGGKVVIDDPLEAERRKLMAKVSAGVSSASFAFRGSGTLRHSSMALLVQIF